MITNDIIHAVCQFLQWLFGAMPTFHLTDYDWFNNLADFWSACVSWDGVFPLVDVTLIFSAVLTITINLFGASIIRFIMNVVRGSGA